MTAEERGWSVARRRDSRRHTRTIRCRGAFDRVPPTSEPAPDLMPQDRRVVPAMRRPQIQPMSKPVLDFTGLSTEQRLELIGQLWDSLEDAPPLSPEQVAELRHRSADVDAHPDEGTDAAQVIAHLRSRLR